MRVRRSSAVSALLALMLALGPTATAGGAAVVFRGATIHPVSSPPIEDGLLVVDGDTIVAVGAEVEVPEGALVVDLEGRHLYPAFVHPGSSLGLVEISSVRGTVDITETGEINPHLRAEVAFHADSMLLPVTMSGGVLTALVVPGGGLLSGTSALMRLDGWNWRDMTLAAPVGMHLRFPASAGEEEGEGRRDEELAVLDAAFDQAEAYRRARDAAAAGEAPEPPENPRLEALVPVLEGELPLFLHAEEKGRIGEALDWSEERGIARRVLVTGADAAHLAERLAADGVPVILAGVLEQPRRDWEPYDAAYTAAARLHDAGVEFAIGDSGSQFGAANARNLPFHAAMAAAFGLPRDVALAKVTLDAARILGVGDRLGSLEVGKEATLIVTDGDPLEIRSRVVAAWMAGREVDLAARDRQKGLYLRYDERPPAEEGPP